jgi:hypothetical protein
MACSGSIEIPIFVLGLARRDTKAVSWASVRFVHAACSQTEQASIFGELTTGIIVGAGVFGVAKGV